MKKDANTEYTSIMGDSTVGETPLSSPMPKSKKSISSMWKPIVIVALAVVVFLAAFFGVGLYFEKKSQQDEEEAYNKEPKAGMTYFVAEESEPEKSATELTSLITEAYYTNDGSLAIRFCFANGMPEAQRLLSVEVKLRNGEGVGDSWNGGIAMTLKRDIPFQAAERTRCCCTFHRNMCKSRMIRSVLSITM